ncbi:PaaX family transcriptional regulator [Terrabacter tumescens]|uniref:PaaX family transcriptional regulator n=1 Tax=Terrabacter tumescens TaxID=60443 RepID=A0ABQ2I532_9MICO|nr:PaaX family transcriptional regulator C-terminal domain-containing protein [Terrabacter tumescens]GGM98540.1 PaaX family transcriptional regulator [Terrabacter tumescens]
MSDDQQLELAGGAGPTLGQARPRAYIVSIYGLYAREVGGWLSVSAVIRLMAELGIDEPAVRSSVSRLKRRDILEAERIDGSAGYTLSASARVILDSGDRRIFDHRPASPDDGWILAIFSVPESERRKRHLLRTRLAWLGYGTVSAGVWVAPAHLEEETREVLARADLGAYVDLFRADYLGFGDLEQEIGSWWDLATISSLYRQFHEQHAPLLASWRGRRRKDNEGEAFADYVRTITEWRRLPFLDPGLPPELLPRDWAGVESANTFQALKRRLEVPAHRFVEEVRRD